MLDQFCCPVSNIKMFIITRSRIAGTELRSDCPQLIICLTSFTLYYHQWLYYSTMCQNNKLTLSLQYLLSRGCDLVIYPPCMFCPLEEWYQRRHSPSIGKTAEAFLHCQYNCSVLCTFYIAHEELSHEKFRLLSLKKKPVVIATLSSQTNP